MVKPATNDFMNPPFERIGWEILAALVGRLHGTPMHVNGFYRTLVATLSNATGSSKTCFQLKYTLAVDP